MIQIGCSKCGSTEFKIETKGIHKTAVCTGCGTYIKHMSKKEYKKYQAVLEVGNENINQNRS